MDAAKVMAMFIPQPSDDLWDYAGGKTGKLKPLDKEPLPWIAITTSAGTGSEVDTAGVITNPDTNEKIGVGGPNSLFAKFAIVDPELMKTVPPKFTAYQGYDQKIKQGTYLNDKVVIDSNIVTSRGSATAYGFAYKLVELLGGDDLAVKKRMVYFNAFDVKEDE